MPKINADINIPDTEVELTAMRSRGPGGQNVNKVSSAIQLRFDIRASTALPAEVKERLLGLRDRRISTTGMVVIKAQRSRSQEKNRADALLRFTKLVTKALVAPTLRKKTRPSKRTREKRLADKAHRSRLKHGRRVTSD